MKQFYSPVHLIRQKFVVKIFLLALLLICYTSAQGATITSAQTGNWTTGTTWVNAINSTLNVAGPLLAKGTLTATANPNTVNYTGAGQSIVSGITYHHGAGTTVNGNLLISSGTLDVSASNFSITLAGDWTNNGGTFSGGSSTVTLSSASKTIGGMTSTDCPRKEKGR